QVGVASEHVATEAVDERQRIAEPPIACPELPLEVGGPHVIRRRNGAKRRRVTQWPPAPFSRRDQACTLENAAYRARCWQLELPWMLILEPCLELSRSPRRVLLASSDQQRRRLLVGLVRAVMWRAALRLQPARAAAAILGEPVVPRLTRYAEALAVLEKRLLALGPKPDLDELLPEESGERLPARHSANVVGSSDSDLALHGRSLDSTSLRCQEATRSVHQAAGPPCQERARSVPPRGRSCFRYLFARRPRLQSSDRAPTGGRGPATSG